MKAEDLCPRCHNPMGSQWHQWPLEDSRCKFRDESELTTDLMGFEGWRVEVRDTSECDCRAAEFNAPAHSTECLSRQTRRFYVGRSTGWKPCHLEIHNRRSRGGDPARKAYASVTRLYKR